MKTSAIQLPNGPIIPGFVQQMYWAINSFGFMETSAKHYGECFRLRLGGKSPVVFFSNPQAIRDIFTANPEYFDVIRENVLLDVLILYIFFIR
jgi:cytochrome P450 family 110